MSEIPRLIREPRSTNPGHWMVNRCTSIGASLLLTGIVLGLIPDPVRAEQPAKALSTTELVVRTNEIRTRQFGLPAYGVAENGEAAEENLRTFLIGMTTSGRLAEVCASGSSIVMESAETAVNQGQRVGRLTGQAVACPALRRGQQFYSDGRVTDIDPPMPWTTEDEVVQAWRGNPFVADTIFGDPTADTVVFATHDFSDAISPNQRVVIGAVFDTDGR